MPIEVCRSCGQEVTPAKNGDCAHCGMPIDARPDEPFEDSQNPYLSPAAEDEGAYAVATTRTGSSWLLWVLFSFEGRIPRRVFWGATILSSLGFFVAYIGVYLLTGIDPDSEEGSGIFIALYLPMLWMSLAITVKRWHDRGKSALWIIIVVVPIIGPLWQLVETGFLRGTEGPNRYGADPT